MRPNTFKNSWYGCDQCILCSAFATGSVWRRFGGDWRRLENIGQGAEACRRFQRDIAFPGLLKVYEKNVSMRKTA